MPLLGTHPQKSLLQQVQPSHRIWAVLYPVMNRGKRSSRMVPTMYNQPAGKLCCGATAVLGASMQWGQCAVFSSVGDVPGALFTSPTLHMLLGEKLSPVAKLIGEGKHSSWPLPADITVHRAVQPLCQGYTCHNKDFWRGKHSGALCSWHMVSLILSSCCQSVELGHIRHLSPTLQWFALYPRHCRSLLHFWVAVPAVLLQVPKIQQKCTHMVFQHCSLLLYIFILKNCQIPISLRIIEKISLSAIQ